VITMWMLHESTAVAYTEKCNSQK